MRGHFYPKVLWLVLSMLVIGCRSPGKKDEASSAASLGSAEQKGKTNQSYQWEDAGGSQWRYFQNKMDWDGVQQRCDNLAKATKKKWHVPTPVELQAGLKSGISTSRNPSFGWVYLNQTWSSAWETTDSGKFGIYVDMANGSILRTTTEVLMSSLCILSPELPNGVPVDQWTDTGSGLIWRLLPNSSDFRSAEQSCLSAARADRLPWRVANASELISAVKRGIQTDANISFGRAYLTLTWSADSNYTMGPRGVAVDMRNGNQFVMNYEQVLTVLCVRPVNF